MPSSQPTSPQGEGEKPGQWVDVESSSIASVSFDRDKFVLYVRFRSGDIWQYDDVPYQKFRTLVYNASSGAYLRNHIIPQHVGKKLDADPFADNG